MSTYALGIMVSAKALHAVLVERTDEEGAVVQFKMSASQTGAGDAALPFSGPEEGTPGVEEEPDDVTIQFGDEGGGGDMFMGSEFDELDGGDDDLAGLDSGTETWNFQAELDQVLDECAERGYEDPEIAFCSAASEIDEVELRLPPDEGEEHAEGKRGLPLPTSRSALLEMLEEQYEGGVDEERVGFVPMHRTGDGRQRVLALIVRPVNPVLRTLSTMQEQTLSRTPKARLLDAEPSLYLGLARSILQLPPETPEKTILVRSGSDDTAVLFMKGNTLLQSEHLPELTAEDSAETVCSRVLLLQDEYGIGEVQHILLIAEQNEEVLADAFKSYFASANLRLLRTHLPGGAETDSDTYAATTGAALRLLDDPDYEPFFQSVNLLPEDYTRRRFRIPVGWSVPVLLALLAVATLGFVWYYIANAQAIGERRTKLRALERQVEQADPQALQRRIDSVQSTAAQYSAGLEVIQGLLRGSNKWSKGMATVTAQIDAIEGLSIEQWSPVSDTAVSVTGKSKARSHVVQLARRLEGQINSLTFTEVRDVPLYNFELAIPLDMAKPRAVTYWRKQRSTATSSTESTQTAAVDSTTPPPSESERDTSRIAGTATSPPGEAVANASSSPPAPAADSSGADTWTVVVASLVEKQAAEQVAQEYRDRLSTADYPVQIRYSSGKGRYRVGVGTFSSFEAGWSTLQENGERLPEDAWMHRYSSGQAGTDTISETP
ncbi:MAG: SPOR domain-containing protein [Salinibacter sp.]|uniref:SPOR domain-containing protein n=1 Tax=Salinibacter sp. TaxID=2065818 RepID=UPI0035D3DD9F